MGNNKSRAEYATAGNTNAAVDIKGALLNKLNGCGVSLPNEQVEFYMLGIPDYEKESRDDDFSYPIQSSLFWYYYSDDEFRRSLEDHGIIKDALGNSEGSDSENEKVITKSDVEKAINIVAEKLGRKVITREKSIQNTGVGIVQYYSWNIGFLLKEEAGSYEGVLAYTLDELLKEISITKNLEKFKDRLEGENGFQVFQEKWVFQRRYVEHFLKVNKLPDVEILNELAACFYEGSENESRVYFAKDDNIEVVECLDEEEKEEREIQPKKLRMVRKLMEISKRDEIYLYAKTETEIVNKREVNHFYIAELVRVTQDTPDQVPNGKTDKGSYIKFMGFLHWGVFSDGKEMVGYYQGKYRINHSEENEAYIAEINRLSGVAEIDGEMLKKLVGVLKKQKHGTSVILLNHKDEELVKKEVKRLCGMNRGVMVATLIKYDGKWDEEALLGISSIDGAIMMDWTGQCLALGVLVDGEAKVKGDVSRGGKVQFDYKLCRTEAGGRISIYRYYCFRGWYD